MPRKSHYTLEGADADEAPRSLTKQEFGARLQRLMFKKGWNQSELARRAGMNRDAVSTYIRGVSYPTPGNLHKLAKALGSDPDTLLPNYAAQAVAEQHPSIDIRVSPHRPSAAWLKVDRLVSLDTALAVTKLLNDDEVSD